jgi:UDP-glucose 4-epimerase
MRILVVGGAGYIGSHMVKRLLQSGHQVVVFDNLSTGFRDPLVNEWLIEGELADPVALDRVFTAKQIDAVMHFASSNLVSESVSNPALYYRNNVVNTLNLLDAMVRHGVGYIIFSSTASIFGEPVYVPIDEKHPAQPINPYGRSKLMIEQVLGDFDRAYGLRSVVLRYFNAAGADPDGTLGERHEPETHLIPLVLQVASGKRREITVYGTDYDTPDGTCIRDYIHVTDLCDAHLLALHQLAAGGDSVSYNLGNGGGFSVQQVVETARQVTGRDIAVGYGPRRPGDPACLVADARLAQAELGWQPRYADLATIIAHAWQWELQRTS